MELYRVFASTPRAKQGEPGHPLYVYPNQGAGRWDNPQFYRAWYLSTTPAGAVGETFGNLARWSAEMFTVPYLDESARALAVFEIPDNTSLLNFDDPKVLSELKVRPSQIVARNLAFTQPLALSVFQQITETGARRYDGLTWWSFHRPHWVNVMLWSTEHSPAPLRLCRIEPLSLKSAAVIEAAATLTKEFKD